MEFRILGSMEVVAGDGAMVRLRGTRERTVLAHLLLSANRVVPAERLADEVAGGRAPDRAGRSLHVYLSRLRAALRESGSDGLIVTRPPGYLLTIDDSMIDATRFERLVAEAGDHRRRGDPTRAADGLRAALAMWRGPALADVADTPLLRAEAARLEEARLAALEERIEQDLADGRHADLVAELEILTHRHRLRERLWAQRMLALYRAGRQADALRAYRDVRTILTEELGLHPGTELVRLESAILRHDPALDPPGGGGRIPDSAAPAPVPALLTDTGGPFVGRRAELARLEAIWAEGTEAQPRLVLLTGEPGVGKTRLAAEFAAGVRGRGATVLAGRCDEGFGVPYQPFVEALGHSITHTPPHRLRAALGRQPGELLRVRPDLAEHLPGLAAPQVRDPETARYLLFEAMASWLAAAAAERPVLLVLDDLQWATKPTLLLLRHVVCSPGPLRLLVVGIVRDTEVDQSHPLHELRADLRRRAGVTQLRLSGLDAADVARCLAQTPAPAFPATDTAEMARLIHAETQGNAFFVREVIRDLTESGAAPQGHLHVPDSVRDVVVRRLGRLSPDANRLLRAAAVVGAEFDGTLVSAVAGLDPERHLDALDEAISARLVVDEADGTARHRFAHAIVRETIYGELSAARRRAAHRRVADALEALAGPTDDKVPALAHHWANAGPTAAELDIALDYVRRAGDRALAHLAHDEAAEHYAVGLALLDAAGTAPADGRRVELLIRQGEAQRRAGDPGYRQTLLDAARLASRTGDPAALARAALANSRGHIYSAGLAVDTERVEVLEAAVDVVGESDAPLRARLLANLGLELAWDPDPKRRLRLSQDALALATTLDDPMTLAHVLLARDYTITAPDNAAERLEATADVLAAADRLGDAVLASRALILRYKAAMELADVAEAERSLSRNEALVGGLGQPALTWATLHQRAGLAVLRGEPGAEAAVEAAHRFAVAAGQGDIEFFSGSQRFSLYRDQGRLDEMHDWVAGVVARTGNPTVKALFAVILAETGDLTRATVVFDELASTGFVHPPNNVNWLRFTADCAWLCARLDRAEHAPGLLRRLEPHADQLVVISLGAAAAGAVSFYLGLLAAVTGHRPEAAARFAAAEAIHTAIGSPAWLDRTRLERGRVLGDPVP